MGLTLKAQFASTVAPFLGALRSGRRQGIRPCPTRPRAPVGGFPQSVMVSREAAARAQSQASAM
jgi:hypothetical protein